MRRGLMNQCFPRHLYQSGIQSVTPESWWLTSPWHLPHPTQKVWELIWKTECPLLPCLVLPVPRRRMLCFWDFPSDSVPYLIRKSEESTKEQRKTLFVGFLTSSGTSLSQPVVRVDYSAGKTLMVSKVPVHTQRQGSYPLPRWQSWGSAMCR
jgi:hypothetical protein